MKTLRIFTLAVVLGGLVFTANAQDAVGDLLGRINGLRGSLGLPGYTLNGALSAAALNQAQWMASTGQISHTQNDGSTPSSRAAAAGYGGSWVSENIYAGTNAGVGDAWTFWLNSPIHYRGMTNPNYQEIGIASASSTWGRAYVLVFGSPGGVVYTAPSANNGGGNSAASGPPPFVVGVDNHGNIMHEVQPDHTIGDILLIYGYTWEDLPEWLALNAKTDADIRRLQIGEIVLVPPYGGTFTPTPYPEGWPTNTPEPDDFVATAIAEAVVEATASASAPTFEAPPPESTLTDRQRARRTERAAQTQSAVPPVETAAPGQIATSEGIPSFLVATFTPSPTVLSDDVPIQTATPENTPAFIVATFTPSPTLEMTAIASLNTNDTPPSAPIQDVVAVSPQGESPWLMIALVVQSVIILGAGFMFVRNLRRK